jgi:choline dehydrogenase-like flavoprotein
MSVRATGAEAYTDGRGMTVPREERVERGTRISGERVVRADVCVIGTGAGGAPVAKELAEGGMKVVMLEEGHRFTADDFDARPREMSSLLYRDAGQTTTIGNTPILLPLGQTVGGSTLINSGTCFRTPEPVLALWRERFGLEELTSAELDPYFRRVERELSVAQVPPDLAGNNALVVKRGADALGWSGDFIYRNAKGCVGSGVCAFGCPTNAKQHTGITYVPRAWDAGATTYSEVHAEEIVLRDGRARGVVASAAGGGTVRVECDTVIVACGAIHTPLLLRRNGIGGRSGELGENLAIHPATGVRALFDEDISMDRGVPQSFYIDEFADEGIMFEGAAGPPDYLAMTLPFSREKHRDLMLRFRNLSQFGVMVSDLSRGSVSERFGRVEIRYDLCQEDVATFTRGIELLARLYWEAGAKRVFLPVEGGSDLTEPSDHPLAGRRLRASSFTLMAFHPLGTARADADPDRGVLGPDLGVHGVDGLYVSDASAVPSSLGVNPQITIMALATRLAYSLLGKPAPDDEPQPEHIAEPRITAAHAVAG